MKNMYILLFFIGFAIGRFVYARRRGRVESFVVNVSDDNDRDVVMNESDVVHFVKTVFNINEEVTKTDVMQFLKTMVSAKSFENYGDAIDIKISQKFNYLNTDELKRMSHFYGTDAEFAKIVDALKDVDEDIKPVKKRKIDEQIITRIHERKSKKQTTQLLKLIGIASDPHTLYKMMTHKKRVKVVYANDTWSDVTLSNTSPIVVKNVVKIDNPLFFTLKLKGTVKIRRYKSIRDINISGKQENDAGGGGKHKSAGDINIGGKQENDAGGGGKHKSGGDINIGGKQENDDEFYFFDFDDKTFTGTVRYQLKTEDVVKKSITVTFGDDSVRELMLPADDAPLVLNNARRIEYPTYLVLHLESTESSSIDATITGRSMNFKEYVFDGTIRFVE